jgi:cytochrome c556
MRVTTRLLVVGAAVLALGIYFLVVVGPGIADDEPAKKDVETAQKVIVKAVGGDADDMKKAGEVLAEKLALKPAMYIFKPPKANGLGYGVGMQGIESKIIELAKKDKELDQDTARKEADDLKKAAQVILTMSYVAEGYTKKTPGGATDPKTWMQFTTDLRSSAKELAEAVKDATKADPKAIKAAAFKVNKACNDCHDKFRD